MSVIWKDGQFLDGLQPHIFHDDVGLSNGLAVFDSMLAVDHILIDAKAHFDRLIHDAEVVLGLNRAWLPAFEALTQAWMPLLSHNMLTQGPARIKTIVTGGISLTPVSVSEIPSVIITAARSGPVEGLPPLACAIIKDHPRVAGSALENCKRVDYTRALAARRAAKHLGAEDAILTNTNGMIACGSTSNIFISEGGTLYTPPLSEGVLAGITRANIIQRKGAIEEPISEKRLRSADQVFLTNSFFGMRPVILVG